MKASRLWLAAWVPLALAACGGGDDRDADGADSLTVGAGTDTGFATPPPPADTGAMDHGASTVQLASVGNSGVTGSAQVAAEGAGVKVTLDLTGARAAGTHQAHIHQGTCEQLGGVEAPLNAVEVDASGNGSSITTVTTPMNTVMDGRHVVSVHEAGGSPGAPIACGAIMSHPM
jgi:hypothetical protein